MNENENENETPAPAAAPLFDAPKGAKDTGRFAAYDRTLGRYVGGTHKSRDDARKAAKERGVERDVAVVEV